jgi:hypothetical protein
MLTFLTEKTTSFMGNGPNNGEKEPDEEYEEPEIFRKSLQLEGLHRPPDPDDLIFFASTDKARV